MRKLTEIEAVDLIGGLPTEYNIFESHESNCRDYLGDLHTNGWKDFHHEDITTSIASFIENKRIYCVIKFNNKTFEDNTAYYLMEA